MIKKSECKKIADKRRKMLSQRKIKKFIKKMNRKIKRCMKKGENFASFYVEYPFCSYETEIIKDYYVALDYKSHWVGSDYFIVDWRD